MPPAPLSLFAWSTEDRLTELLGAAFDLTFESATSMLRMLPHPRHPARPLHVQPDPGKGPPTGDDPDSPPPGRHLAGGKAGLKRIFGKNLSDAAAWIFLVNHSTNLDGPGPPH